MVSHANIHLRVNTAQERESQTTIPTWSRPCYQLHRGQPIKVKGFIPTQALTKEINSRAFRELINVFTFRHTRYHSTASVRWIASLFLSLNYAILKFKSVNITLENEYIHTLLFSSVNCQNIFCKSNTATQRKSHRDAHILWPTNSTTREFIQGNNLVQ